jgi:trk system potassium uptake protein
MQALVIGAGNFGSTVAVEMAAKKNEVIVIDIDAEKLDDIKDRVGQVIVGDATDAHLLDKFSAGMDIIIVSLGERVDASVLIVHHLKEIGAKRIIAKATTVDHAKILKIVGATQVVNPEKDEAIRLVRSIVFPDVLDVIRLSDQVGVVEVAAPEGFIGKAIKDLELRKKYRLQVLAIQNPLSGKSEILPSPDYVFKADDIMVVLGVPDDLMKFEKK